jgi:TetR/AcrR family transcriptional regulator, mexJK operon transcriptional repressor
MTAASLQSPKEGSARERIRDAAIELFLQKGYEGVSVDAIARASEVSKPTIYAHFEGKEDLFVSLLEDACERLLAPLVSPADDRLLSETLHDQAQAYAAAVLRPEVVAMHRLFVAEAGRFPQLSRRYFQAGPKRAHEGLADFFRRQIAAGAMRRVDPEVAAAQFAGMVLAPVRLKMLFKIIEEPDPESLQRQLAQAVEIFLGGVGCSTR